jgi:hypothetical protein
MQAEANRRQDRHLRVLVGVAALVLALTGCQDPGRATRSAPATSGPTSEPVAAAALEPSEPAPPAPATSDAVALAQLPVTPEPPRVGYDRDQFVHWIDADHDGCDTRCEVLAQERRTDLPGLSGDGWLSAYDGYSTDDASELDIDHVIPLAEAWDSGAAGWDPARRKDFANDLGEPASLIAVTAASNRSKSDRDPAEWQPSSSEDWCRYAHDWISTKVRWSLAADPAEVAALGNMLNGCPR